MLNGCHIGQCNSRKNVWLQCGEWIIIKSRVEARQPGHKILQQFKKKKKKP